MANVDKIKIGETTYDIVDNTARSAKQDVLVSGINIKTINGNSLLGGGDLTISGGSGESTNMSIDDKLEINFPNRENVEWPTKITFEPGGIAAHYKYSEDDEEEVQRLLWYYLFTTVNAKRMAYKPYVVKVTVYAPASQTTSTVFLSGFLMYVTKADGVQTTPIFAPISAYGVMSLADGSTGVVVNAYAYSPSGDENYSYIATRKALKIQYLENDEIKEEDVEITSIKNYMDIEQYELRIVKIGHDAGYVFERQNG